MVAAMPLQNDARPSEKTVTLRDLRRVAFGLSAAIMIVMIAGAINDDSGSSTATAELSEKYRAVKCASLLRETMWSMVSEITSNIDFDYKTYTNENLIKFENAMKEI